MSSPSIASTTPDYETLAGTWESPELEPIFGPDGDRIFLTRTFDFDDAAWRARFSGWSDHQRYRDAHRIRLVVSADEKRIVEQPTIVADHFRKH